MTSELQFGARDYWRAIILYGLNTATYKIALAQALGHFAAHDRDRVTMSDLAETFFDLYAARLIEGKPQLATPGRLTVMERIVQLHRAGSLTRERAIARVETEAFGDVIPRFHKVGGRVLPAFYEASPQGLILTDALFDVFGGADHAPRLAELDSRWSLLEAAFTIRRDESALASDIRALYLRKGYERTDITGTVPVLDAYQHNRCFYCGEPIADGDIHVDHVIPRQLVNHDEIWNLVLAHSFCNLQKSDALPDRRYIEKLFSRNEHLIASARPISVELVAQLGATPERRRAHLATVYDHAREVLRSPLARHPRL